MPQLEYSDFCKFIVSVGIGLIVMSLVLPWLFLREPFDLLLDSNQLSHLTPSAQAILAERQLLLVKAFRLLPWISGLQFLAGILLAATGLIQWRRRQFVRDQSEDFGLEKLRRELTTMSAEPVAAKLEADLEQERETEQPIPQLIASTERIRDVELDFYKKLGACFGDSHTLLTNQRLGSANLIRFSYLRLLGRLI